MSEDREDPIVELKLKIFFLGGVINVDIRMAVFREKAETLKALV